MGGGFLRDDLLLMGVESGEWEKGFFFRKHAKAQEQLRQDIEGDIVKRYTPTATHEPLELFVTSDRTVRG